jgi:hypothetical protein
VKTHCTTQQLAVIVRRLDRKICELCCYSGVLSAIDFRRFTTREQDDDHLFWIRALSLTSCFWYRTSINVLEKASQLLFNTKTGKFLELFFLKMAGTLLAGEEVNLSPGWHLMLPHTGVLEVAHPSLLR